MKCSCIQPAMWDIIRHSDTGQSTNFRIMGKETTDVVGPTPPTSNSYVCEGVTPCDCSMCCLSDEAATYALHSEQNNLVRFLYLNFPPSPVAIRVCDSSSIWPNMKPGVKLFAFVFSKFVSIPTLQNMYTVTDSVSFNQFGNLYAISPTFS